MKPLLAVWFGALVMVSAVCAQMAGIPAAAWLGDFQRYCGQDQLEVDYGFGAEVLNTEAGRLSFRDVLRGLPAPDSWPDMKPALSEWEKTIAAENTIERQRVQAARWLFTFLSEGRNATLAAVSAAESAEKNEDDYGELAYAYQALRRSLDPANAKAGTAQTSAEHVKAFEDSLDAFTEVSEEDVKEIVGAEKLAVLRRLVAAQKEAQQRVNAIYEAARKSGDAESASKEVQTLSAEFTAKYSDDYQQLLPLLRNEMIARYWRRQLEGDKDQQWYGPGQLYVPDLVSLSGTEHAGKLLRRALQLPLVLAVDDKQVETRSLARRIAIEEITALRAPQWGLTMGEESGALFEALRKQFPEARAEHSGYREASVWRVVALVRQGEIEDALVLSEEVSTLGEFSLPYDAFEKLTSDQESFFVDFLLERVRKQPGTGDWTALVQLSSKVGRPHELTELVDQLVADAAMKGLGRITVQRMKADSELAQEKIESAMGRLLGLIQEPESGPEASFLQMAIAGRLLTLAELHDAGQLDAIIAAGGAILERAWRERTESEVRLAQGWMEALNEVGRHTEAARVGIEAIEQITAADKEPARPDEERRKLSAEYAVGGLLREQLCALSELGRWDEVAVLLSENGWWQARDLAELLNIRVGSTQRPLGFYVARLALVRGDRAGARQILEAQVKADVVSDAVYEAWLELAGIEALPLLEKLAAADRYEERPLIWKAHLLIEAGRWDEAESVLRAAIAIDPSDGEQGRGDRMRVYVFMARVMAGKGDAKQAAFFEDVVKAIRLSERADGWFEAGAYSRAIALYRESLGFFADAYCIQSRLAVRLSKEGEMDEAVAHYEKAFELMPDSFGRVESHCFGCEKVFEGEKTQSVAEEVFTRMLAARPDKPQLHYLMGYLNQERGRIVDAAKFYRAAVKLDPLYLNAWNKLLGLDERAGLSESERDDLVLTLATLDPARRHVSPDLGRVTDLTRLWRVLDTTGRQVGELKPPATLWPLPASAAALVRDNTQYPLSGRVSGTTDFATVIAQSEFGQALQMYLVALARPGR